MLSFKEEFNIPPDWVFDRLPSSQQLKLMESINSVYKKYVYGSFYNAFESTIYSFNLKEEWIKLASPYVVFFQKYKRILMNATNYQLAIFLEKYNSSEAMQYILTKLELVSVRNSLTPFRKILELHGPKECFYCGKTITNMHVDHFVPWSYMQNDFLWNFVLSCQKCNTSKNNKIAHEYYLEHLVKRNNEWSIEMDEEMKSYKEDKLIHLYDYAIQNGFQSGWRPNA